MFYLYNVKTGHCRINLIVNDQIFVCL